jgi:Na+/H+-dicarboxylate symporter
MTKAQRIFHVLLGIAAGLILGATLGQLLGVVLGVVIDFLEINLASSREIVVGGVLGLVLGTVLVVVFYSFGKLLFSLIQRATQLFVICSILSFLVGVVTASTLKDMISSFEGFMVFGGSIGLWVGIMVGSFVGAWVPLNTQKVDATSTTEEKRADVEYSRFLNEKSKHE